MASLAIASAGASLGSALGLGANIGWIGGHAISRFLSKKKTEYQEGKRLENLSVQTSTYGRSIPILYGRYILGGNIIWSKGIKEQHHSFIKRINKDTKVVQNHYSYSVDLAIAVCEGPIDAFLRIWANDTLIFDQTPSNPYNFQFYPTPIRFYHGNEEQFPDFFIESIEGRGNVPGFRGLAYVVFEDFPLADFKNKIPCFRFEVTKKAYESVVVHSIATEENEKDNITLSPYLPHLYLKSKNTLQKIDRLTENSIALRDVSVLLPRTETFPSFLFGHLIIDPETENIYAFAQNQLSSFLNIFHSDDFSLLTHNFEQRLIGDESVGYIHKSRLYTADYLKGSIRAYDKKSLERHDFIIHGASESGLHQRPGNFTHDLKENLWLVSYNPLEQNQFFLTRFTEEGYYTHFTFKKHGYATGISFDIYSECLIVNASTGLLKINLETMEIVSKLSRVNSIPFTYSTFLNQSQIHGILWVFDDNKVYAIETKNFLIKEEYSFNKLGIKPYGLVYDNDTKSLWSKNNGLKKILLNRLEHHSYTLPETIADILKHFPDCNDFFEIHLDPISVDGYILHEPMSLRESLSPLMQAYFFAFREHDDQIELFHPGQSEVVEINPLYLGAKEEENIFAKNNIELSLKTLNQLPKEVSCLYNSIDRNYEVCVQKAKRNFHNDLHYSQLIELPLLLSDQSAAQVAEKTLFLQWMNRLSAQLTLPVCYSFLEPGDIIAVPNNGKIYRLLITQIDLGANGRLEIQAVADEKHVYQSYNMGVSVPLEEKRISFMPPTDYMFFEEKDQIILLCSSKNSNWPGAVVYLDQGEGFEHLLFVNKTQKAFFGKISYDFSSQLHIIFESEIEKHILSSCFSLLVGNNKIDYGSFKELSEKEYIFQDLTYPENFKAFKGQRCVLLHPDHIVQIFVNEKILQKKCRYKIVTLGQDINIGKIEEL